MTRPTFDQTWLDVAAVIARRATCPKLQVGAVIVDARNQVVATGYNGAARGTSHCTEVGCDLDPKTGNCVAGSTVISKFQGRYYNHGHRTIRDLWEMWQAPRRRTRVQAMRIRAISETGMIVPDRIVDVWSSGVEPVFRVRTSLGREVTTTAGHRFRAPDGWRPLESFRVGDLIGLNGRALISDADWLHDQYVTQEKSQAEIARLLGCNRKAVTRALIHFGMERRTVGGGWNRGLPPEQHPQFRGVYDSVAHARQFSRRHGLRDACEVCGAVDGLEVHHIDGDAHNIDPANWRTLCPPCHRVAHTPHAKLERIMFDWIVSIEPIGEEEVFDLTTKHEHSFVGNGFALHNCLRVVHAEVNAVMQAGTAQCQSATIFLTHSPCLRCATVIGQSGISRVVWAAPYHEPAPSIARLAEMGVIAEGPA